MFLDLKYLAYLYLNLNFHIYQLYDFKEGTYSSKFSSSNL